MTYLCAAVHGAQGLEGGARQRNTLATNATTWLPTQSPGRQVQQGGPPACRAQGAKGLEGGTWQANYLATKSSKVAYLLQRLQALRAGSQARLLPQRCTRCVRWACLGAGLQTPCCPSMHAASSRLKRQGRQLAHQCQAALQAWAEQLSLAAPQPVRPGVWLEADAGLFLVA